MRKLFLVGPRHSGKTTAIFRALRESDVTYGGFAVKRVWTSSGLERFDLMDLVTRARRPTIVREGDGWRAEPGGFIDVGVPAIRGAVAAGRLVVMDELGVFEAGVAPFEAAIAEALSAVVPVLGVIKEEAERFRAMVAGLPGARVVPFSATSREEGLAAVRAFLGEVAGSSLVPLGR